MNEENIQAINPAPEPQPSNSPSASQQPLPQMPEPNWFAKNKKGLVRLAIVVIILGGALIYARYQTPGGEPVDTTVVEKALNQKDQQAKTPEIKVKESDSAASPAAKVKTEDGNVTVTAQRGQGYTHLAREALAEYLKSHPASLTPEHKIYIEDYLQKHLADRTGLHAGEQVMFSESAINDAVSSAQALAANQLSNLHQYAERVPGLK